MQHGNSVSNASMCYVMLWFDAYHGYPCKNDHQIIYKWFDELNLKNAQVVNGVDSMMKTP